MSAPLLNPTLSEAHRTEVLQHLADANGLLPFLVTLNADERRSIKQLSDRHYGFITKLLDHLAQHPAFKPAHMDADKLKLYFDLIAKLNPIKQRLEQLQIQLSDTLAVLGTEVDSEARKYYKMVSLAAKDGVPNAQPIYDDLRSRFPGGNTNAKTSSVSPPAAP